MTATVNIPKLSPETRAQVCHISTPCTDGPLSFGESGEQAAVMSTSIVPIKQSSQLAKLEAAHQALAECRTLPEVLKIQDLAEAARVYARKAHLGWESQNYAAEIALLAACKAGKILKQLEKSPQSKGGRQALPHETSEYAQTIKDTQTPERTARYWQELGSVPEEKRTEYINSVRVTECGEITSSGLLKACRSAKPKSERTMPAARREDAAKALAAENLFPGYDVLIAPGGRGDAVEVTFYFPHPADARAFDKKLHDAELTAEEIKTAVRQQVKERLAEIENRKRVA